MSILLSLFYFFYFSIIGVYVIFMPKVLSTIGYSAEEIGVIFAAGPLVRFILPFLFIKGFKLDNRTFNIALIIMLASSFSFYHSVESFYKLLFSNIFLGVGLSLILPYIEVIALENIGKEKYGRVRLFGSIGFVLVSLVLVRYSQDPHNALSFLLTLNFVTAGVAFVIARVMHKKQEKEKTAVANDISLLRDWKLWAGLVLMQVSFGAFYNFFTIYATDNGISMESTIYLWSFGVFCEIVMLYYQGQFLKNNLLLVLQITMVLTVFRWLLLYMFIDNLYLLYFSQSLHAFSFALFHSAAITYLYQLYANKALAQQFFSGVTYGLGGFSGALFAGYVYENYPEYLFLLAAFFVFVGFVFLSFWKREANR